MFRRRPVITPQSIHWAVAALLAAGSVTYGPAWAANDKHAAAPVQAPAPVQPKVGATVTLDFADAAIDAVARTMATITGRNVVVDPRVKGTMTLQSTDPVTPAQALRLFSAQLRAQGYALVDSQGIYAVLPEADAKLQAPSVSAGPVGTIKSGGQIQTQIFRLTHENASNLVPVLRPLISPNNTINVDPSANALVITDYGDNLRRIARIIATLDVANATGIEIVRLRYAVASDLAPLVAKLLEPGSSQASVANTAPHVASPGNATNIAASVVGAAEGYRTTLIPEPHGNAIIVRAANPARLALAKSLIEQLDQPADSHGGEDDNIHVVYLKNADAAKLAMTLRAALAALPGQNDSQSAGAASSRNNAANTAATQPAQNLAPSMSNSASTGSTGLNSGPAINAAANNQPSTGGQIQADPATNSLIISAPEPVYRELRAVIDKLDQRRAQVYVESLIAEINTDRAADFGIQWQGLMRNGNTIGVIGTNFSTPSATSPGTTSTNIINLAAQFVGMNRGGWVPTVAPSQGFNLALGSGVFGLLANFIQSSGAGNVLSTPTLLTLDNEEARIMVGQNVPIVTGSYTTNTTGTGNIVGNPFQTYDRRDVGITLRVRPQISEDGSIKLVIYQEVSDVVIGSIANASGPSINKRAIESSVIVNDGQIVVLGGLLQDQYTSAENKIPVLGDIPLLGNLFKSRNRSYVKTDLMVFLRPVIVRDAAATENYSLDRYEYMRALQQGTQPTPSSVLNVGSAPVMPAATPVNPQTASRPAPPAPLIRTMPSNAQPSALGWPEQPQSFTPTSGDGSDISGSPIKTER